MAGVTGRLEETIAPTLLTWIVSAGVVVLVSALTFSAGYALGKEAGRAEAAGLVGQTQRECGKEASRWRWGSGSGIGVGA